NKNPCLDYLRQLLESPTSIKAHSPTGCGIGGQIPYTADENCTSLKCCGFWLIDGNLVVSEVLIIDEQQ
ncbi:hypothetical protein Ancab_007276, partial [Ancistrocladus abbreviatus]